MEIKDFTFEPDGNINAVNYNRAPGSLENPKLIPDGLTDDIIETHPEYEELKTLSDEKIWEIGRNIFNTDWRERIWIQKDSSNQEAGKKIRVWLAEVSNKETDQQFINYIDSFQKILNKQIDT